MRLRHSAIAISFSMSFAMFCRRLASSILGVASGTGEHIVHFARNFPALVFQSSDPEADALLSGVAWVKPYALTAVAQMINQANGKRRRAAWTAHQRRLKTGRASAYRVAG